MRKLAIGRLIGVVIAVSSILGAVYFYCFSNYLFGEFQKWTTARPMMTAIDFSQPGTITVPFHQTCSVSHAEGIYLEIDTKGQNGDLPVGILAGLSARIIIHDQDGKEIVSRRFIDNRDQPVGRRIGRIVPGEIMLADIPTFKTGHYNATITVDACLPALSGLPQVIYAKYQLCGCEQLTGVVFAFFSFCTGFIGIIAVLSVTPGLWRSGFWREEKAEVKPEVKIESDQQ